MSAALISAAGVVLVALITFVSSRLQSREKHSVLAREIELRDKLPEGAARDELDRLIQLRIRHMRFRARTSIDNSLELMFLYFGMVMAFIAIVLDNVPKFVSVSDKLDKQFDKVGWQLIAASLLLLVVVIVLLVFRRKTPRAFDSEDPADKSPST